VSEVCPNLGSHDPSGVRLGGLLADVERVRDPQSGGDAGARDRALALLEDMGEFVGQGVRGCAALADDHMVADSVGAGAERGRGGTGRTIGVHANPGEVRAQAGFHLLPDRGGQRLARVAQQAPQPGRRASAAPLHTRRKLIHLGRRGMTAVRPDPLESATQTKLTPPGRRPGLQRPGSNSATAAARAQAYLSAA
jgi:hypothetical protein